MDIVNVADVDESDIVVHQTTGAQHAYTSFLTEMTHPEYPVPFGIIKQDSRPTYDDMMTEQIAEAKDSQGQDFAALVKGKDYWEI